MHTHFRAFFKNFLRKFISSLVPTGKYQIIGCFWKIFYLVKSPLTYLELQSQMTPYFTEKMRKYFYSVGGGFTFLPKKPLHLFPLGTAECTPWIAKNFIPSLIGIERSKRTLFFRKNNLKRSVVSKTSPHLFPLAEDIWGRQSQKAKNSRNSAAKPLSSCL